MKQASFLIKPASSLCNMNCQYCFYSDVSKQRDNYSKGVMKKETVDHLVKKAMEDALEITFAFQGGEPTVAGINYFIYFMNCVEQYQTNHIIHYAIQTNGYELNEKWISLFQKYHFLVGISLDGNQFIHNQLRLKNHQPTFDMILKHIHDIQKERIDYNILTVVTSQMIPYAKDIYQFYKQQNFDYIQFIPCLPELNQSTKNYALKPQEFYQFYHDIFPLWYEDLKKGRYTSISLFEDLLMIFQGRYPRTCGILGNCQLQMIIEGDGSVYPCDFYAIDEYCLGNINDDSLSNIRKSLKGQTFLNREKKYSRLCQDCQFKNICHGQCQRMNVVYFDEDYCGYQEFLKETYQIFYEIGKNVMR